MGIKGIYGEIGPGERVAFLKLAVEKLEKTGEPFRVAIDVSIWQFQTQSGQGGSNPAIRTFYYRLLRLLSISVQPVFVFDGPNKPPMKRGKKTHHGGASVSDILTRQMLDLFGFPYHQAPGEAEAECALLQRHGIVDAVLSEDVDTLMFGCGMTLRNWSSEGTRGNKAPTHVSVYNAKATKEGASGLDREGMVLVALMSGGDYTEGIPGCGIKVACQAARAGYGKSLCQIPRADVDAYGAWRKDLVSEIQNNQSKFFRTKHTSLTIDENWPDRKILGYYTHPVVSSAAKIESLKMNLAWDGKVNIPGLRQFVADAFEWTSKAGAMKFIRGLAPVLLVHKLLLRRNRRDSGYGDLILTQMNEMEFVRSIAAERKHFSTDALRELRLVYMPIDIAGLDLDSEHDDAQDYDRDGLAPVGEDDQIEAYVSDDAGKTGKGPSQYDPTQLDKVWVPATIARLGIPLKVEDYEESLNAPKKSKAKPAAKKAVKKAPVKKSMMPQGAMDRFVSTSKPSAGTISKPLSPYNSEDEDLLPPTFLAPMPEKAPVLKTKTSEISSKTTTKPRRQSRKSSLSKSTSTNPWSLSSNSLPMARVTKSVTTLPHTKASKPIVYSLLSSSPVAPSPSPAPAPPVTQTTPTKHQHSPSLFSPEPNPEPNPEHRTQRDSISSLDAHEELGLPSTVTISRHRSGRSKRHGSKPTDRSERPSEPRLSKRATSSSLLMDDSLNDSLLLNGGDIDNTTHDDWNGFAPEDGEDTGVARKLDFNTSIVELDASAELRNLSPQTSAFSSFIEQDVDLGLESEPELPSLGDLRESQRPSQKITDIIDLSSSPPTIPPVRSQPSPVAAQRYIGSSKIHSFFNSTKSTPRISNDKDKDRVLTSNEVEGGMRGGIERKDTKPKQKRKKIIILRESLAGAWKEVDEDEADLQEKGEGSGALGRTKKEGRWRMSEVEMLDLTGAD